MAKHQNLIRTHHLSHLGEIEVDDVIFQARFRKGCTTCRCDGICCKTGVWMDLSERDRILANAGLIRMHMDPGQVQNPDGWFDSGTRADSDFPSGQAVGAAAHNGSCVFLNNAGRCVLQIASSDQAFQLKPFFCYAFPIYIDHGKLMLDEGSKPDCCIPEAEGELDIFDVCLAELKHVLGESGLAELLHLAARVARRPSDPPS